MDQSQNEDENDLHLLIDSGTESITESPVNDDESEQSDAEDKTVCDVRAEPSKTKEKFYHSQNLLDKSFSIDEEILATPLEPIPVDCMLTSLPSKSNDNISVNDNISFDINLNAESNGHGNGLDEDDIKNGTYRNNHYDIPEISLEESDENGLKKFVTQTDSGIVTSSSNDLFPLNAPPSILRRLSNLDSDSDSPPSPSYLHRRVSFPTDTSILVTYREPDKRCKWKIAREMTCDEIIEVYQKSCKKYKTLEQDIIKNQLQDIKNNCDYSAILNLSSINVTPEVNETLEDILRVTNFHTVVLYESQFTPETLSAFLNMLEYYESASHIEFAMQFEDDYTFKCFCNAITNILVLESISIKGMVISTQYLRNLTTAISSNSNVTSLKFDACKLNKLPAYLLDYLHSIKTIRELYLPSTSLYTKEIEILERFLSANPFLKVLDISNNVIGDHGLEILAPIVIKRDQSGNGLSVLIIYNNKITEKSGEVISNIVGKCNSLHLLNIGGNSLKDECLIQISNSLPLSTSLEALGLRCTLLTCKGIESLAVAIQNNKSLRKIDLKANKAIQSHGVEKLCEALTNSKIIKIEIDDTNRTCNNPDNYAEAVIRMNAICTINKSLASEDDLFNQHDGLLRKVSLSCEPMSIIPDFVAPISSHTPKSRFQISKVHESSSFKSSTDSTPPTRSHSRFRVTRVASSPEDDPISGRFENVRSSVSSNDSVEL